MREIKFRGLRTDGKGLVYGDLLCNWTVPQILSEYDGNEYLVIPETVGQFVGLKDKNEKDIYEGDVIRVTGSMQDGKYKFDSQYSVDKMDYKGFKMSFIKLTNELPDSIENSYPISQSPSFYYGSLTTDYQNNKHNNLAFKDTFGENILLRTRWKEHDYTNNIEVIGNIHEK